VGLGWEPRPPLPWRRVSAYIAALRATPVSTLDLLLHRNHNRFSHQVTVSTLLGPSQTDRQVRRISTSKFLRQTSGRWFLCPKYRYCQGGSCFGAFFQFPVLSENWLGGEGSPEGLEELPSRIRRQRTE